MPDWQSCFTALSNIRRAEVSSTLLIKSSTPLFTSSLTLSFLISFSCLLRFYSNTDSISTTFPLSLPQSTSPKSKESKASAVLREKGSFTLGLDWAICAVMDKITRILFWTVASSSLGCRQLLRKAFINPACRDLLSSSGCCGQAVASFIRYSSFPSTSYDPSSSG